MDPVTHPDDQPIAPTALGPIPAGYAAARDDFHRLAYAVVAEARRHETERFGLRPTLGGYGTPVFGDDVRVRVADNQIHAFRNGEHRHAAITTVRAALDHVGLAEPGSAAAEHDSPPLGDVDAPLATTVEVNRFLGDWYGLASEALEAARSFDGAVDVSIVQLWPGHFDPAIELGDADAGRRATYGASPGDATHDEPYLYIGAWADVDRSDPFWNETAFNGASLTYAELRAADDPVTRATEFFRDGFSRLSS